MNTYRSTDIHVTTYLGLMARILVVLSLVLGLGGYAKAEEIGKLGGQIVRKVCDSSENCIIEPVAYESFILIGEDAVQEVTTDAEGYFKATLSQGTYRVASSGIFIPEVRAKIAPAKFQVKKGSQRKVFRYKLESLTKDGWRGQEAKIF